jgi:hypothetical protein
MIRHRIAGTGVRSLTAAAAAVIAVAVAGCGAPASQHPSGSPGQQPSSPGPVATPLAPISDYSNAVTIAIDDGLQVWIEADLVKRWEEGPTWFAAAVSRVAALANRPGVAGIKIADELGYNDGLTSATKIRNFLTASARALHGAAPGKLILVDMLVPELGCLPGHQPPGSGPASCAARLRAEYPQLSLAAVNGYLRLHAINVLDLSTDLQTSSTYAAWGTTTDAAQADAWQQVQSSGWPGLVYLQARKALAHPGIFDGSTQEAAAELDEFVDIPLHYGAHAVDIWTWHQEYLGQMYQLMNPGLQSNALWSGLAQLRANRVVLFTHMSPHSVESGVSTDLAQIASVFTDVFLPAGTG